jgi:DNA helicase-2/ATP-dependent DNA helicase PcrA
VEIQFYAGQAVIHSKYGSGVVAHVEGSGDDMLVTVEFREAGRKQVLPKYAPLRPVD